MVTIGDTSVRPYTCRISQPSSPSTRSIVAAAGSAAAQTAPADPAQLDEIVVTAERRSENLQDVPVSVGVVQGDQLRAIQAGGGDILELAARVPGLYAAGDVIGWPSLASAAASIPLANAFGS